MALQWKNLDLAKNYLELLESSRLSDLSKALTKDRINSWTIMAGGRLKYFYGASLITEENYQNPAVIGRRTTTH